MTNQVTVKELLPRMNVRYVVNSTEFILQQKGLHNFLKTGTYCADHTELVRAIAVPPHRKRGWTADEFPTLGAADSGH